MDKKKIRNFSIIAHIDHGKSTLADRILELTATVAKRDLQAQHLDSMDLERERGITIKLNAAQIVYQDYLFHLIDTPGHVDFTYEVSRSLAATEGAILLVDAAQGIEAQTIANAYLAIENNLKIIPIINKIDLKAANVAKVKQDIEEVLGIAQDEIILISAKNNWNIEAVLEAIIKRIPAPFNPDDSAPLKALIFDSYFDIYRGVVLLIRIFEGQIKLHDEFILMSNQKTFTVSELGIKRPQEIKQTVLQAGEVGWIAASIRSAHDIHIGDTITLKKRPTTKALLGYKKMKAVVFTGFYPLDGKDYQLLKESLEKIALSDSSIAWELETSKALGFGFRVGFLGLLHMDVLQERLAREFKVALIATTPSVTYEIRLTNGTTIYVSNPADFPKKNLIKEIYEPYIRAAILVTENYIGPVMELCQNKRGKFINIDYYEKRVNIIYEMPLGEIILDFFDRLKSVTKGYASFDYDFIENRLSKLEKVDILLNHELVDAFSFVSHFESAYAKARLLTEKLKKVIPRQNFEIPVQAIIGSKVIARETIKAYRKDVTAKLYGGDVTRRQKLLKKQKLGKKRMKSLGSVEVPQEAFLAILKSEKS